MATGRATDPRTVTVTTTNASTTITGAAGTFTEEDSGRVITGTGIPANATVTTTTSDTTATLSAAATASGSISAVIGTNAGMAAGNLYGFYGWSPESDAESESNSVAAANAGTNAPDRILNPYTAVSQRGRG